MLELSDIPAEIIDFICSFLDIKSLDNFRHTCRLYDEIADFWVQVHFNLDKKDLIYSMRSVNKFTSNGWIIDDVDSMYYEWRDTMLMNQIDRMFPDATGEVKKMKFLEMKAIRTPITIDSSYYNPELCYDDILRNNYKKDLDDTIHQFRHEILKAEINGFVDLGVEISRYHYSSDNSKCVESKISLGELNVKPLMKDVENYWRLNRPSYLMVNCLVEPDDDSPEQNIHINNCTDANHLH